MNKKDFTVDEDNPRLDKYLHNVLTDISRSQVQNLISDNLVKVNGELCKASQSLKVGDQISLILPDEPEQNHLIPQAMPLDIVYENEDYLIVNKPRGLVVHPAPGHYSGTLANGLLAYLGREQLSDLGGEFRPGIVHRLDKDTAGMLLLAKNNKTHKYFADLFKKREVERSYKALVWGHPQSKAGMIDAPIGRDPLNRQRMAVVGGAKAARTHFQVLEEFRKGCELRLDLESGRSHQIRVHLKFIKLQIVGDKIYGGRRPNLGMDGQALHAYRIAFIDPQSGEAREFTIEPPEDYLSAKKELAQML